MTGQLRRIVVALDQSDFAVSAAHWGAWLSALTGAELALVHVLETRIINGPLLADICGALGAAPMENACDTLAQALTERAHNIMSAAAKICEQHQVEPSVQLLKGTFIEEICTVASDAELLILGRRGEHASFGDYLLGSDGERAIRRATCSCLVVPGVWQPPTQMVIGVHDSEPAAAACRWADFLHRLQPALKTTALHVREPGVENLPTTVGGRAVEYRDGDPEAVLIEACAAEPTTSLCIIGVTRHARSLKELLLGTVAFHLLHKVSGPVLLAR